MKSEISTSIFCFSISSEILSTCLYFLKLISSSYSLPSIVVFTHGRNWAARLGRFFLRHRNTPRFLYRTTFRMLSLHICLFHNNRRTQNLLLFSSSERNPPIPAKISKYFISANHLLSDFSNKKTVKLFSKLDRHIDIFISSSSVGSLSSLTIWKSSTPGITPSVLPLSKTQCTVPISSICSIFFVV